MAQLNEDKIKRAERGELIGNIASIFCGVVFVYFIVLFAVVWATDNGVLKTVLWSTAPALMAMGIGVAAYFNLTSGRALEREIKKYVTQVFVENAQLMHPDKDSLSFRFDTVGKTVEITVNGYKDKITFDFSTFRRFGAMRKMSVMKIISDKLSATFCRLFERGFSFKSVEYSRYGKSNKKIAVIANGVPDKKIMKNYLKTK